MIISLNLLKQFVDLNDIDLSYLLHKLTFSGLEVEGVHHLAKAKGLVIGEILSVKNHNDSDHLHILEVDEGEKYGIKQIVCGAKNVKEHLKVIVARDGAIIGNDDVKITKSKIRGVESYGMCCSLEELGVDKSLLSEKQCSGIEELDENAPVGEEDVLHYLGLDDVLIEINVLANRSDCLALYSFAKEVSALLNRKLNIPYYEIKANRKSSYKVSSKSEYCKQFSLRVVRNIKVKKSPIWLQVALRSEGIRSINNIVDIGNYVMLLTGRPIHMYDINKINSQEFVVRDDLNLPFIALDEKEYQIQEGDLVVTDKENPLCLAGIMGGLNCAIDDNSCDIAIECASFSNVKVRRTSTRLGLASDSSSRFVKGINPKNDKEALELASYLLQELADASIFEEIVTYDVREKEDRHIACSFSYINHRLGTSIAKEKMEEVFKALNIDITLLDEDNFLALPPEYRIDLKCDADLSEEIFRIIGLEEIKPTLPLIPMTLGGLNPFQKKKRLIREHLVSLNLNEVLTYTLINENVKDECALLTLDEECYKVKNPMTIEHSVIRKSLLASLFDVVKYNNDHQKEDVAIFETSLIETKTHSFESLGIVLKGHKFEQGLLNIREYNFYDILGIFESILTMLGINKNRLKFQSLEDNIYFHPFRSLKVYLNNKLVGVMGELHPTYMKKKDLKNTYALEIDLSSLCEVKSASLKMESISKYPFVTRDYAFVIKKEVNFALIEKTIKKYTSSLIKNVEIFDVYEGEHVANSYKSIALRLTYGSNDHTLVEKEISEIENKAISALSSLGGELRK